MGVKIFEKIFWLFGKRLYFCTRFPSWRREYVERDEKEEIACVWHTIKNSVQTRDESRAFRRGESDVGRLTLPGRRDALNGSSRR